MFDREKALKELRIAETYRDNLIEKYIWMEGEMKKAYEINSGFGKGGKDIRYVNDNNKFIQMLKIHMRQLSEEIAFAESEFKKKHESLMELQLKVKKIELHKESEYEKFKKERKKLEQKMTDEINSTRKRGRDAKSV